MNIPISFPSSDKNLIHELTFKLDGGARFESDEGKIHPQEYEAKTINVTFNAGFDQKKLKTLISEMVHFN